MLYTAKLLRWFERKKYQYEVTFSLYMLTSTEKFIFNSVLFLFLAMIIIASCLYLPEHASKMFHRASFYWGGNETYLSAVNAPMTVAAAAAMGQKTVVTPAMREEVLNRLGEI